MNDRSFVQLTKIRPQIFVGIATAFEVFLFIRQMSSAVTSNTAKNSQLLHYIYTVFSVETNKYNNRCILNNFKRNA